MINPSNWLQSNHTEHTNKRSVNFVSTFIANQVHSHRKFYKLVNCTTNQKYKL